MGGISGHGCGLVGKLSEGMGMCRLLWAAFLVRCLLLRLVAFSGGRVNCQVLSGELGPAGADGEGRNFRSLLGMVSSWRMGGGNMICV